MNDKLNVIKDEIIKIQDSFCEESCINDKYNLILNFLFILKQAYQHEVIKDLQEEIKNFLNIIISCSQTTQPRFKERFLNKNLKRSITNDTIINEGF